VLDEIVQEFSANLRAGQHEVGRENATF